MTDETTTAIRPHLMGKAPLEALTLHFQSASQSRDEPANSDRGPHHSSDPNQIDAFLRHALFANVRLVNLACDPATQSRELSELFRALLIALPKLRQANLCTTEPNLIETLAGWQNLRGAFVARGKTFSVVIGVRGVGEAHDELCNRPGSFANAAATLAALRDALIPAQAIYVIDQTNLWQVDELLLWSRKHQFRIHFCVEQTVDLIDHQKIPANRRAFNPAETRHLVSFFHKLLLDEESDQESRLGYQSILSLLTGGRSILSSPAQITLKLEQNHIGHFRLSFFENDNPAPQVSGYPPILGDECQLLTQDCAHSLCTFCISGTIVPAEVMRRAQAGLAAKRLAATGPSSSPWAALRTGPIRNILIIGWYGTETNGDIAILGGVLDYYRNRGTESFTVCSLFPFYSRVTLLPLAKEMGVRLTVSSYDDPSVVDHLELFDLVSMAGGPLMDLEQTELVRNIFRRARAQGIACHLDGCGVGPLHQPRFQSVVAEILQLATRIHLRDQASTEAAKLLAIGLTASVLADPSIGYVRRQDIRWHPQKSGLIRAWLRLLTPEYPQATSIEESTELVERFLRAILSRYPDHRLELGAMHWFPMGGDDREFAQELAIRLDNPRVQVDMVPHSPREIITLMAGAELNLCMRFHSVVFAHTVGVPFIALDYTAGGKVAAFMRQAGHANRELRYSDLAGLTPDNLSSHICPPTVHDQRS